MEPCTYSQYWLRWYQLRIRRVKCDEDKPSCLRCRSTGRTCDGYTANKPDFQRQDSALILKFSSGAVLPRAALPIVHGDEKEQRSFSFFCNKTVAVFSDYCDLGFWDRLVLQVSNSQPAVRHAIVALGALHESFEYSGDMSWGDDLRDPNLLFSIQQYIKSIAYLQKYLSMEKGKSIEITLICCALFISIETLHGNFDATTRHLLSGSKILSDWLSSSDRTKSSTVQDDLLPIFIRLSVQVKSITDTNLPLLNHDSVRLQPVPRRFTTLQEARNHLYTQMNNLFNFIQIDEIFLYLPPQTASGAVSEVQAVEDHKAREESFMFSSSRTPEEIEIATREINRLHNVLQQWLQTFEAFLSQSTPKMNSRELSGAILLKLHHITAYLILATSQSRLQTVFDTYLPCFEKIVSLSASLIAAIDTGGFNFQTTKFRIDIGVIGPLYLVATRCREPLLRRKAVQLLRREGAWDREAAALVADRIIRLEEEGLGPISEAKDIPEYARIHVRKVIVQIDKRLLTLSCYNPQAFLGGRPQFREECIAW